MRYFPDLGRTRAYVITLTRVRRKENFAVPPFMDKKTWAICSVFSDIDLSPSKYCMLWYADHGEN